MGGVGEWVWVPIVRLMLAVVKRHQIQFKSPEQ